jgi:hypothetical protein
MLSGLRQAVGQSDLFALLAFQIPSMMRLLDPTQVPLAANRSVLALDDVGSAAGAALVLVLAGLLLTVVYLTPIAQTVRAGQPNLQAARERVWYYWLWVAAFLGLLLAAAFAIAVVGAVFSALFMVVGLNLLPLFLVVIQFAALWLVIYLFFVVDAVLVSEVGPIRAIRYSIAVVHSSFWASLAMIGLTILISLGLQFVFIGLARQLVLIPVTMVANAYISTGLAAAGMIFYRDRLARWQQKRRAATLNQVGPGAAR